MECVRCSAEDWSHGPDARAGFYLLLQMRSPPLQGCCCPRGEGQACPWQADPVHNGQQWVKQLFYQSSIMDLFWVGHTVWLAEFKIFEYFMAESNKERRSKLLQDKVYINC